MNFTSKNLRKLTLVFGVLFTIFSFQSCNTSQTNAGYADVDGASEISAPESIPPSLMDSIQKYAPTRKDKYSISDNNTIGLKKVHPKLVEYALLGRIIENWDGYYLKQDASIDYYYFDKSEMKDKILFTILQRTEDGYDHFFLYAYDRELDKITSLTWIGSAGGHAGESMSCDWFYYNKGLLMESTNFRVRERMDETASVSKIKEKMTTTFQFYEKNIVFNDAKFVREY